ncbi:nucleotidyl transferase AbiEii/AbiGii toxin family protein [Candidatus Tisiphia endosymbiont of Nemotelus uliginosus]|uniref:nucleotidyl transferase AbiEii/AbiGii toxin family protein n=1 Tax=Candidatus Tisiphia endosymbiont of Nemotelus uliginosus TaxID=3077926 RepID=UPI0035C8E21A
MIPESFIENWRVNGKWQTLSMVEQDLVISRALICLYNNPQIKDSLVFRGGTALNKLFIKPPVRYSEDIDFVQKRPEPIGLTIDAIRQSLKPWLGDPKWKITERSVKLVYQYKAISGLPAKLKIEINTTEHFQVLPLRHESFSIESQWFNGVCEIVTYELAELVATKLRALYQRRKGRDLFDLWYIFKCKLVEANQVIHIFQKYCANDSILISKELFQKNMELKRLNKDFQVDMNVLLPPQVYWNFDEAFEFVQTRILSQIP